MSVSVRCCLLLIVAGLCGLAQAADGLWAMRPRIYCQPDWGISFRYPYKYYTPDQYAPAMRRTRGGGGMSVAIEGNVTPEKIREAFKKRMQQSKTVWDVRAVSWAKAEVPSDVGSLEGKGLAEIAKLLVKNELSIDVDFSEADYYEEDNERRPHASLKDGAPEGIKAVQPNSDSKFSGWFVEFGDRYAGVLCKGGPTDSDNELILNSFEVLRDGRRNGLITWRHAKALKGYVTGRGDLTVKPRSAKPVPWDQGWDIETAHYHVRVQSSPKKLQYFAGYLDALYDAFVGVYNPDSVPPFKMEIHIFRTQRDFMAAAGAHGVPVGPTVGGFFMPGNLSIFAYEESEKWGGADFSVEHVIAHECSHQFLHTTCNGSRHVPTWINEGLAVYFEGAKYKSGRFQWHPPKDRLDQLRRIYHGNKRTLAGLDYYMKHFGHIAPAQYAEVYAITHFFVFGVPGNKRKGILSGRERFKLYWQALKKGEDGTKAFQRIFMDDMIKANGGMGGALQAFDEMLQRYVKSDRPYKQ